MKMTHADRLRNLLVGCDRLNADLTELYDGEAQLVKAFDSPRLLRAFQNCQLAVVARTSLEGVLTAVFNRPTAPYKTPGGQVDCDRNIDWFSERIDGLAPAIGLSCAQVTEAILDAAEAQLAHAQALYQTAFDKICASNQPS